MDKIIAAAKQTASDAIHPGYGFLSENEDFAAKVKEAGLMFIGPSAASIELMGNKLAAKAAVAKFNVPLVPGTAEPITDVSKAKKVAREIGYPILIKASAGGGGKGMRIVEKETEFEEFCRRLVEAEICPNIKPQTGPVGGGDSKVDASTHPISKELAESPRTLHPHFRLSAIANMQETLAKWPIVRNQICNFASDASRSYLLSSFH